MSTTPPGSDPHPVDLRLRSNPRPTLRLSRKFLIGLTALGGAAIGGALMLALQPPATKAAKATDATFSTKTKPVAERFNALPKDYTTVPQLGPPLPGDLGKAVLDMEGKPGSLASNASAASVLGTPSASAGASARSATPAPTQAESQALQARDTAKTSQLFAPGHSASSGASTEPSTTAVSTPAPLAAELASFLPPAQTEPKTSSERQVSFLNQTPDRVTVSPDRLQSPASPYVLQAGSIIPAALITGLRSDLPGQVTAQVSENVYDSVSGRFLLIPQGSKLIGQYDNAIAFGQSRVLLAWTRLILPNGKSLVLEKLSATDPAGYAGLSDQTDYHWAGMLQAAAISTLLSVGTEAGSSENDSDIVRALRTGASDSISRTGDQVVERQLNIQPTLTIRPGFPVRVILSRDLVLEPYGD